jgi:iron complex transport system substrate-binding protein
MVAALAAALLLAGCGTGADSSSPAPGGPPAGGGDQCIESFDPSTDYFPDKVEPTHSTLWDVEYERSYVVLRARNSETPGSSDLTYVLVRCGAPEPELSGDLAGAQRFTVPVARTVENHNNALAMLEQLGVVSTVVGMSDGQLSLADDPYLAGLIEQADDPVNVGDGDGVEYEITLGAEPDIVIEAGYGPGYTNVTDDMARGLPVVMVSNRLEPEPLGSSEWMKFLAPFYGKEAVANERFAAVEAAYQEAVATIAGKLPADFTAAYLCIEPDNGCEFMYAHGDQSLNGKVLQTLGATNPFAEGNEAANGKEFAYEEALGRAADVDFIVDYELPDAVRTTLEGDARFQAFEAFADGDYITYVPENHGFCRLNLYVQVDILITDIAAGMAPELFPGRTGRCFAEPTG